MAVRARTISHLVALSVAISGIFLTMPASSADLPQPGDKAPGYGDPGTQLGLKNYSKRAIADPLELIASGKKLLLYFWSAQDRMCEKELSSLETFRSANQGAVKILAVAFPASGDSDNAEGRQLSEKHSTLDIIFDDSRRLYSLYCPKDKSESGSAFLISAAGVITATRTGDARNGDLIDWVTSALDGKAQPAEPAEEAPRCPDDCKDHVYQYEIMAAVKSGYMTVPDGSHFKPDAPVLAKDFVDCLKRLPSHALKGSIPTPDKPDEPVTREQATKLFATAVYAKDQIDLIMDACDGAPVYLSDYVDSRDVASWAENYFALAVFKGWISDRYRLYPKEQATRGYIASLLARAFPDSEHAYTGLVVRVPQPEFQRAQSLQIITQGADESSADVLYPDKQHLPPLTYLQSPGMVSYCTSIEDAIERRAGKNPLIVTATDARKVNGKWQLVLDAADAEQARKEDTKSLILRTWRVAVVIEPKAVPQAPEPQSATSEPTAKPDQDAKPDTTSPDQDGKSWLSPSKPKEAPSEPKESTPEPKTDSPDASGDG